MAVEAREGVDMNEELMLDGNAVAGLLAEIFGADVSASRCQCASCGNRAAIATTHAFTHAPGVVLRCSVCDAVAVRIVEREDARYVDMRGLAWVRVDRSDGGST